MMKTIHYARKIVLTRQFSFTFANYTSRKQYEPYTHMGVSRQVNIGPYAGESQACHASSKLANESYTSIRAG